MRRSSRLRRGQDAPDSARATADLSGQIGTVSVGFEHVPIAIRHRQH